MMKHVIIVAGGSGKRFGSQIPKQFLPLSGLPVLMHTIRRFARHASSITLALPQSQMYYWKELCGHYSFSIPTRIVAGGDSRFESVKNAISSINIGDNDIIAVHDGVRPLVSDKVITDVFNKATENGSAIPAIHVTDSIRMIDNDGFSHAVDRSRLVAVQTPQAFNARLLKKAYDVPFSTAFTDDASVYEYSGHKIHIVDGDARNIKITHPDDIEIAEKILANGQFDETRH